jgi:hypothetical protein
MEDYGFLPNYVVDSISPRQLDFLRKRYGLDKTLNRKVGEPMTLKQLGDYYNVSAERARNICDQGLKKLRQNKQLLRKDTLCRRIYLYTIANINFSKLIKKAIPLVQAEEKILADPINVLELSRRTFNQLKRNNVQTIGDVLKFSPDDLLGLPEIGTKSVGEIVQAIESLPHLAKTP